MALKGKDAFNQFFSDTNTHSRGFIPFKGLFLELFAHYRFLRSGARFIFWNLIEVHGMKLLTLLHLMQLTPTEKKARSFYIFCKAFIFPVNWRILHTQQLQIQQAESILPLMEGSSHPYIIEDNKQWLLLKIQTVDKFDNIMVFSKFSVSMKLSIHWCLY